MSWKAFKFYLLNPIMFVKRIGNAIYELRHPGEPWLAPAAVRFLDETLQKDMVLFEWGSGRSTLWFADRVKKVISVEYHQEWAEKVKDLVEDRNNVDLRYVPLDHPWKAPTQKYYDETPQYVAEIEKFAKGSLDVIIVDGHYRLTCVDKCLDYLSPNGFLVIDNSNREKLETWGVPSQWPLRHESENVMTRTSVWQKQ